MVNAKYYKVHAQIRLDFHVKLGLFDAPVRTPMPYDRKELELTQVFHRLDAALAQSLMKELNGKQTF